MGMPVDEFVERAWQQLVAGSEHVIVGFPGQQEAIAGIAEQRKRVFEPMANAMLAHFEL